MRKAELLRRLQAIGLVPRSGPDPDVAALTAALARYRQRNSELEAEAARLRGELDVYQERRVLLCLDRDLLSIMDSTRDEFRGTLLRATDTGREFELHGGVWLPRE